MVMQSSAHPSRRRQALEPERGRSRTPKSTPIAMVSNDPGPSRHSVRHQSQTGQALHSPSPRRIIRRLPNVPQKGKSPDRSQPGALEAAIHEAHARGDLRQCLQWVLELQGVHLDWDDPRLDTVTEDDLCFAESTGMGVGATEEERARAEKYWAMRRAEEEQAQRVWEMTATTEEKEASRRFRARFEAEQRKRDARAQYFRAPRGDKVAVLPLQGQPPETRPAVSRSLNCSDERSSATGRPSRSRPAFLFPVDENELSAVRSMWLEQGRKGFNIVETLVRPPPEVERTTTKPSSTSPELKRPDSPDSNAVSDSVSTSASPSSSSLSSSAPSTLFSSVLTTTSIATSVSTVTCGVDSSQPSLKVSPPCTARATTLAPVKGTFTPVSSAECPLHTHMASGTWRESSQEGVDSRPQSTPPSVKRVFPRRARTTSATRWLSRGSKVVEDFVGLVGRLPAAYLPVAERETSHIRAASCPPPLHHLQPLVLSPPSETLIYLLPLRPPSYPRIIPPLPSLPRSPYRPLIPPSKPTPRLRLVQNPQYLRLKALQNQVLWGLLPVPRDECNILADIAERHSADACPGRPDVDRLGQMFTAREALLRVAMEGIGRSSLCTELAAADEASTLTSLWAWWRIHNEC